MRLLRGISSWRMAVALMAALASVYLYYAPGEDPFGKWTHFLFHRPAGMALYAALILNLLAMSVMGVYSRLKPATLRPWDLDSCVEIPSSGGITIEALTLWARKRGFKKGFSGNTLNMRKARLSVLPGTVMRTGFILFLSALFLSSHVRKTEVAVFHEGERKGLVEKEFTLSSIQASLPGQVLDTGGQGLRLDEVTALLSSEEGAVEVSSGYPAISGDLLLRIGHLGIYQPLTLHDGGYILQAGGDLDVLPPGRSDIVILPEGSASLSVALEPTDTIKKGLITGKIYDLREPLYRISMKRGKEPPAETTAEPGGEKELDGARVSLGADSLYIKVEAVRDPALIWIYAGLLLAAAGLALMPLRLFWYQKQLCIRIAYESVHIGYTREYYKEWADVKLRLWAEELREHSAAAPPGPGFPPHG